MFLALAIRLLALPLTALLLLFELPGVVLGGLPLPLRFSPVAERLVDFIGAGGEVEVEPGELALVAAAEPGEGGLLSVVLGLESGEEGLSAFGAELDEPPNILLNSRPP